MKEPARLRGRLACCDVREHSFSRHNLIHLQIGLCTIAPKNSAADNRRLCLTLIEITGDGCIGYILPDHWLIGNHFQEIPGKSELGLQSKQREPSFQGGEHCLAPSASSASLRTQTDPDS
ncbi:uncharacterized protein PGTG_14421 [Puccinia graminis f. sp. tritici CRL 75-36-700-3]|uniref:Uncharacterized protein n=1 Tax=Puccinia graminis f. sp. tritici (strain CRL 75-36-700-3 / race SCCL) TaxID=418459 RepID=E3KVJ7_PUCGT|nr:uncharacterized protein PGTG_14421 [Puccinia graminis f. sp. tritici CRL 75-36-700-3]EFP88337.1 hypothetical protein PGTG_14421 [Puccinia graminis f. sp. tritici CRL 75-36-700-3]